VRAAERRDACVEAQVREGVLGGREEGFEAREVEDHLRPQEGCSSGDLAPQEPQLPVDVKGFARADAGTRTPDPFITSCGRRLRRGSGGFGTAVLPGFAVRPRSGGFGCRVDPWVDPSLSLCERVVDEARGLRDLCVDVSAERQYPSVSVTELGRDLRGGRPVLGHQRRQAVT
jgi:hypothetical protein